MGSLVFEPTAGSTVTPDQSVQAVWTYTTLPLTAFFTIGGVLRATWAIGAHPLVTTTEDGAEYYVTAEIPSPPATVVFTISQLGGWQGGAVNIQIDTTDAGADEFTGAFTIDPILPGPKLDYGAEGLERMLDQFDGSVNLRLLAQSYLERAQDFEIAADPLLRRMNIEAMVGDRLDGLGQIVDVLRSGRTDTEYRLRIRAELAVLTSQGSTEELIAVARLLLGLASPPPLEIVEYYPKTVYMRPVDTEIEEADALVAGPMFRRTVSAATEMLFVYSEYPDATTFTLSSQGATTESSASLGLADVSQTTGGHLSGSA
jgi:hypothetical protein